MILSAEAAGIFEVALGLYDILRCVGEEMVEGLGEAVQVELLAT